MFFREKISYIVAGLGNPGSQYAETRHNCGYMALDFVANKLGVRVARKKFSALTGTGEIAGRTALFIKPLTYMNLSGQAIAAAAKFYKIPPERVIVMCDDIALPCGVIRIRPHGSAGGHNGLKSIIACLGSDGFPRIRIGVGENKGGELSDYVLDKPGAAQQKLIAERFPDVLSAAELIAKGDIDKAMSEHNSAKR